MAAFFLWIILFILCWPLALLALVLYPFVWLLTLPFRLAGIAVPSSCSLYACFGGRGPSERCGSLLDLLTAE